MRKEKKILLVGNDHSTASVLREILQSSGHRIKISPSSGKEALLNAEADHPDLVLINVALAGDISGVEAAAIISDQLEIPVVFLVAEADERMLQQAKSVRPAGFLHNPVNPFEVNLAIETALCRWKLERQLQLARARAEEEKAKTLAVFSAIGVAVAIMDSEYRVLYQNRLHKDVLGETTFGEYCFNAYGNSGRPCAGCSMANSLRDGTVETFERKLVLAGHELYLEITTSPLRNQAGDIIAGIEVVKDITRRREMEEALAESEARYRKVTELSPDAIIVHDEDGVIRFANSGSRRLFDLPGGKDLDSTNILDFFSNESRITFAESIMHALVSGESTPLQEAVVATFSGVTVDVEVTSVPFFHHGKRIIQTILRNISDRKKAEQTIRRMAYYDSLTGLPNRRLFDDRLSQILAQARRHNRSFAVLFIDVDHFKKINDTLGHVVGDKILQEAAARLTDCCRRQGDTVARFGGDEFTIILPEIKDRDDVEVILNNIFDAFTVDFVVNDTPLKVNLSIGVSMYPEDGDDVHALLIHADKALYAAKESGRGVYAFYSSPANLCHA